MIENENIICFGFAEWDNPYRTNQHHMMERFSARNRVLFIESLGLRRPTMQGKDLRRIFKRLLKWCKGIQRKKENLYVFSPLVLPLHRYAAVRAFNKFFLSLQLAYVVRRLGMRSPVLWSYIPNAVEFLGRWGEKLSVYHCVDELSANPLIPAQAVREMEERFLRKVNIVFTTAPSLYESKKHFNEHTYYLPNVADFDHFTSALDGKTQVPDELQALPSPRLGFVGAISEYKLDLPLLLALARRHPEWTIVLVGARGEGEKAADLGELESQANVHLPGGRPYASLPGYLKGFDVCLLPNRLNEYTKNMFPMKFFEYLSAGKPVVATRLAAIENFGEYCYLSGTVDEFERNVVKALNETDDELRQRRIAVARKYTWETRLEEMDRIIKEWKRNHA